MRCRILAAWLLVAMASAAYPQNSKTPEVTPPDASLARATRALEAITQRRILPDDVLTEVSRVAHRATTQDLGTLASRLEELERGGKPSARDFRRWWNESGRLMAPPGSAGPVEELAAAGLWPPPGYAEFVAGLHLEAGTPETSGSANLARALADLDRLHAEIVRRVASGDPVLAARTGPDGWDFIASLPGRSEAARPISESVRELMDRNEVLRVLNPGTTLHRQQEGYRLRLLHESFAFDPERRAAIERREGVLAGALYTYHRVKLVEQALPPGTELGTLIPHGRYEGRSNREVLAALLRM